MRKHLLRALLVATAGGTTIVWLQNPIIDIGLAFLGGSNAVYESAVAYSSTSIWSAPATLGNFVLLGYLLGRQRVMVSLALQVALNLINLATTLTLVFVFDWGVAGIGAGTALAEWIAFGAGLMIVRPFSASVPVAWRDLLGWRGPAPTVRSQPRHIPAQPVPPGLLRLVRPQRRCGRRRDPGG